jgi:acyl-CoA thioesterase I
VVSARGPRAERARVAPEESALALRRILQEVEGAEALVVGPPAVDDDEQNERLRRTSAVLREVAAQEGAPFVDCFEATEHNALWRREVREGDGYHPGAAGYEELARIVAPPFLAWLDERFCGMPSERWTTEDQDERRPAT